jgi:SAM-dependent methyltransferase
MNNAECPLCGALTETMLLIKASGASYRDCESCGLVFLERSYWLTPEAELAHYQTHNNDVHDPRYQKFVAPIVEHIRLQLPAGSRGLDYGAGPGPVISHLLSLDGFEMSLFDPFYWKNEAVLKDCYDFIVASEVVEHFHYPNQEFTRLRSLLNPGGRLAILTHMLTEGRDFKSWYYHQDPTHVVFYRPRTLEWIKRHFNFSSLELAGERAAFLKA